MQVIEISRGVPGYPALLSHVLRHGLPREPRGVPTLDAGPTTVVMHDVSQSLPLGTGRNLSRSVAAAEALQLIGGFSAPELLPPAFDPYREPDGTFWGAYGNRIGDQVLDQVEKLRRDPETRQSVLTLWSPTLDNQPGKRDYPCTVALMYWLDDDALCAMTVMRSQDVWLGTPYDWFQFTQLQQTLARQLDVPPGVYRHVTTSTHLYLRDVDAARKLVSEWYAPGGPADEERAVQPSGLGRPGDSFAEVQRRADRIRRYGWGTWGLPPDITDSERWYAENIECFGEPPSE